MLFIVLSSKKPKYRLTKLIINEIIISFLKFSTMDQEKLDRMRSVLNKLEDIKNSQESVIDKINHVITDLFQNPDKELEKAMEEAHQKSSDNVDAVREVMEDYEIRINKLENQG